jgi:hypothetical protein
MQAGIFDSIDDQSLASHPDLKSQDPRLKRARWAVLSPSIRYRLPATRSEDLDRCEDLRARWTDFRYSEIALGRCLQDCILVCGYLTGSFSTEGSTVSKSAFRWYFWSVDTLRAASAPRVALCPRVRFAGTFGLWILYGQLQHRG